VLAREFMKAGHHVEVVTETLGAADLPFTVHRRPAFGEFYRIARRCDVVLAATLSLRRIAGLILSRTPLVISQQDTMRGLSGASAGLALLKRAIGGFFVNVVPSRFMADFFPGAVVIMNPYDNAIFHWPASDGETRRRDILFVGRIVGWKGIHVLVEAFSLIAARWPQLGLSIVGEGPEREAVMRQVAALGLANRVNLVGTLSGSQLGDAVRRHEIMVVPSVSPEPFGIVALEGLACGCKMVVSRSGGLPEAIGSHALTFAPGDSADLATKLEQALASPAPDRSRVEAHLAGFAPHRIAATYLDQLRQTVGLSRAASVG